MTGYFPFKINFPAKRKCEITTKFAISCNCCCAFGFLFITIFGLVSAPFLSQKHFKLIIMLKEIIYLFQNWDDLKDYPFFGLKLKYAIWIIPIPFLLFGLLVVLHLLKALNYL